MSIINLSDSDRNSYKQPWSAVSVKFKPLLSSVGGIYICGNNSGIERYIRITFTGSFASLGINLGSLPNPDFTWTRSGATSDDYLWLRAYKDSDNQPILEIRDDFGNSLSWNTYQGFTSSNNYLLFGSNNCVALSGQYDNTNEYPSSNLDYIDDPGFLPPEPAENVVLVHEVTGDIRPGGKIVVTGYNLDQITSYKFDTTGWTFLLDYADFYDLHIPCRIVSISPDDEVSNYYSVILEAQALKGWNPIESAIVYVNNWFNLADISIDTMQRLYYKDGLAPAWVDSGVDLDFTIIPPEEPIPPDNNDFYDSLDNVEEREGSSEDRLTDGTTENIDILFPQDIDLPDLPTINDLETDAGFPLDFPDSTTINSETTEIGVLKKIALTMVYCNENHARQQLNQNKILSQFLTEFREISIIQTKQAEELLNLINKLTIKLVEINNELNTTLIGMQNNFHTDFNLIKVAIDKIDVTDMSVKLETLEDILTKALLYAEPNKYWNDIKNNEAVGIIQRGLVTLQGMPLLTRTLMEYLRIIGFAYTDAGLDNIVENGGTIVSSTILADGGEY